MRSHSAAGASTWGRNPLQVGVIPGEKVHHPSASSRQNLLPRSLKLFLQLGRRRVRFRELVLYALALHDVLLDFFPISQVEGDRSVNLLQLSVG
jgi:hypothetical protein